MTTKHLCLAFAALLLGVVPAAAEKPESWSVKNRLQGKTDDKGTEKSEDVSGIACAGDTGFPRLCLAVDDETQGAQVVILQDGMLIAGDFIKLIDDAFGGKPLELDAEAVAYADGAFYVVGSHGRPRHETDAAKDAKSSAKAQATRKLFRITIAPQTVDLAAGTLKAAPKIETSTALGAVLQALPDVAPFYDQALADNGLTIEGLAVQKGMLYAGLRGPVLDGKDAAIVEVPVAALFGTGGGADDSAKLHRLALGADMLGRVRGIRDLVATGDGFLLIAGPEQDPPKKYRTVEGDYSLFAWQGGAPIEVQDFPALGKKLKPEALLPLKQDGKTLHALVMFDGGKEGEPVPVEIKLP